jgi:energy-coupling factor transporter ATP-binding protein EcfA2
VKLTISAGECLAIFGRRGSGKSTLLRSLLGAVPPGQSVILYDILGELGDLARVRVDGARELVARWKDIFSIAGARVQVVPGEDEEEELVQVARLCGTLRCTTLVLEEADVYLASDRRAILEPVRRLVKLGRHQGSAIWCVGRRPADIDRLVTSQARILAARTVEPRDLAYFAERFGAIPWDRLGAWEFFSFGDGGAEAILKVEPSGVLTAREIA